MQDDFVTMEGGPSSLPYTTLDLGSSQELFALDNSGLELLHTSKQDLSCEFVYHLGNIIIGVCNNVLYVVEILSHVI